MIGILTFHFAYNYGAVLQAYALKTYLCNHGEKCEIVNYRPSAIEKNYHITLDRAIKSPKLILKKIIRSRQDKLFDAFQTFLLNGDTKSIIDLKEECGKYRLLITGSDQVWNTKITQNDMNYFLGFVNYMQKRVAYGASVGNNDIFASYTPDILHEIERFSLVSFRENSTLLVAKNTFENRVPIYPVVDPVLLLTPNEWELIAKKPLGKLPQEYILFYALTESEDLIEKSIKLSHECNLPIVAIHPMCKQWKFGCTNLNTVGPLEFLWLIKNAAYICTNSFHGSVFSAIFKKKAILVSHEKLGERNKQLLNWLNLSEEEFGSVIHFNKCNDSNLNEAIIQSKKFISLFVKKKENSL